MSLHNFYILLSIGLMHSGIITRGEICTTEGCNEISALLASNANFSMDPCEDFFLFTCGKMIAKKESTSTFGERATQVEKTVAELLESSSLYGKESPVRSAKRFLERCLDTDPSEVELKTEARKFVEDFANWPLFNTDYSSFDVWDVAARLQGQLSVSPFFQLAIRPSEGKCEVQRYVPTIQSSRFVFLPYRYCEKMLPRLFDDVFGNTRVLSNETIQEVCTFEDEMWQYLDKPDLKDSQQEMYLDEIDTIRGARPIFKSYFDSVGKADKSGKLANWLTNETIAVENPSFLEFLVDKVESTSKETIGNVLLHRLVKFVWQFFMRPTEVGVGEKGLEEIQLSCSSKVGSQEDSAGNFEYRQCKCLEKTLNVFPRVAAYLFINPTVETAIENEFAGNITELVRTGGEEIFAANHWLSELAKVRIAKKLADMEVMVGYEKTVLDIEKLIEMYANQTVRNNDNFFNIYTRFSRFSAASLGTNVDPFKIKMAQIVVNAMYNPWRNSLTVPTGILKTFGLKPDYPDFYNFGAMGTVIGHEIFHGFDETGVFYDHSGSEGTRNAHGPYLVTKSSASFDNSTKCFVNDYSQHTYQLKNGNLSVDGQKTLSENLADFNGIRATFNAFQKRQKPNNTVALKDFPNRTEAQMFYISYASVWCSNEKNDDDLMEMSLARDPHSPADARVNVLLRNIPQFREAFHCKPTDAMYHNYLNGQCTSY